MKTFLEHRKTYENAVVKTTRPPGGVIVTVPPTSPPVTVTVSVDGCKIVEVLIIVTKTCV